jgi:hypothetical protein
MLTTILTMRSVLQTIAFLLGINHFEAILVRYFCNDRLWFDRLLSSLFDAEEALFDDTRHTMFARLSAINSRPNRSTAKPTASVGYRPDRDVRSRKAVDENNRS